MAWQLARYMKHPKMRDGTAWVIITDGETNTWPSRLPKNTVVILVNDNLKTGQPAPDKIGWNYTIPPHIKRVAVCISEKDFKAGGAVVQRPGRHVA